MFYKLGYPPEDCEDLTQEVYLLLWKTRKDLVGSPLSFWLLKFYKICSELKSGKLTDPLSTLISVRNSEREDLLGTHPPPDEELDYVTEDVLKLLPAVAQEYFRSLRDGYTVREIQVIMNNANIFRKIKGILEQPDTRDKLLEYLRST
jgi:DNA-directed RNA polymerase specialized sigma24 family protein